MSRYIQKFTQSVTVFGKTAVLFGGNSSEREVSLKSGNAVLLALKNAGVDAVGIDLSGNPFEVLHKLNPDRVFIVLHGAGGEDGKVQAALDLMGLPYTGSDHAASALAMDKLRTKQVWQAIGLPTPNYECVQSSSNWDDVMSRLGGCAFVKPIHEGSSIGLNMVDSPKALKKAYQTAKTFDKTVLVEQKIEGDEFTVAILNGVVLPTVGVKTQSTFYDFNAKYESDKTEYFCPSGLSDEKENEIKNLALTAFNAIGCSGWGRVDIMQNGSGDFYLLEVNTVPGMTDHSLVPMAAKQAGLSFEALTIEILAATLN